MVIASRAAPRGARTAPTNPDALVIGAGPGGLATAAMLLEAGLSCVVVERSEHVGQSWRDRHAGLRLNSVRWMSGLPGYPIERRLGRWVGRDDYVAYLERYAERFRVPIRSGTVVRHVDHDGGDWRLDTNAGALRAPVVVVATGWDRVPVWPDWTGASGFSGRLEHAVDYRSHEPFRGAEVLVAGLGSSGAEIAVDLMSAGASSVSIAYRTPPNVFPRQWLGLPISAAVLLEKALPGPGSSPPQVGDAFGRVAQRLINGARRSYRLPPSPFGVATTQRQRSRTPVIVDGLVEALREGRIGLRPEIVGFDGADVLLGDGSRVRPDAVIAATGYRHGLEDMVGHLGVLDADGAPVARGAETAPDTPGLHFVGYRLPHLYEIGRDARAIAHLASWEVAAATGAKAAAGSSPEAGRARPAGGRRRDRRPAHHR